MRHAISFLPLAILLAPAAAFAQGLGIGTLHPHPRAALEISATDKGLLIPRMDSVQRAAISSPPDGLIVFQTSGRTGFWYYFNGQWMWLPPGHIRAGDNLGNHTATQNLNLNGNLLTGGGTNGLMVTSGGNVGIGTTSPAQRLDVAGTARITNLQVTGGATTGWVLTSDASGNATWQAVPAPSPATTTSFPDQTLIYSADGF